MRLVFHPKISSDISSIMKYYEQVSTPELADEFYSELRHFILTAVEKPKSFAVRERDVRRVNLQRFPYHFLFRICERYNSDSRCPPPQQKSILWDKTPIKSRHRSGNSLVG